MYIQSCGLFQIISYKNTCLVYVVYVLCMLKKRLLETFLLRTQNMFDMGEVSLTHTKYVFDKEKQLIRALR